MENLTENFVVENSFIVVHQGDPKLKSILQLMAASQCGRNLVYFTFRDKTLVRQLSEVHDLLMDKKATVGMGRISCWFKFA